MNDEKAMDDLRGQNPTNLAWIPYKQIAKSFSRSMLVILGIISKLTYFKTLTVLINGTKPLNRVSVIYGKNPVSLTLTGPARLFASEWPTPVPYKKAIACAEAFLYYGCGDRI
jgi:hypothetical protein